MAIKDQTEDEGLTLQELRKSLNLPEIKKAPAQCLGCARKYPAEFEFHQSRRKRISYLCDPCNRKSVNMVLWTIPIGT